MFCNRCQGSGFLNLEQADVEDLDDHQAVLEWIAEQERKMAEAGGCSCHIRPPCSYCMLKHDVEVCDCCGDGTDWYGEPGYHYTHPDEPFAECN